MKKLASMGALNKETARSHLAGAADFDGSLFSPSPFGHTSASLCLIHKCEPMESPYNPSVAGIHHALWILTLTCGIELKLLGTAVRGRKWVMEL